MVAPHQETQDRDSHARIGDEAIAEDRPPRETGNDLGDDPHAGKDHDVDRRVRIEPEQVLEQDRVAPQGRVEDADAKKPFDGHEGNGDRQHRRAQHHDQAGRVMRPDKERQTEPRHAGARIVWIVTMKFRPVKIDEKPVMNTAVAAGTTIVLENIVLNGV